MGTCRYCGQAAGFLKKEHSACASKHAYAVKTLPEAFQTAFLQNTEPGVFRRKFDEIVSAAWINSGERQSIVAAGLKRQAEAALEDHLLTQDEEKRILAFRDALDAHEIMQADAHLSERLVKAAILRDLDKGKLPSRVKLDIDLPILLGREEKLIWAFKNVDLWELKTRTRYVGGSHGVSIRIVKGVYYRVGASKGERIQETNRELTDQGVTVFTDRHLFFLGGSKNFRLPWKKIVSIKMFEDGIEITKDSANPKPQILGVDDPGFAVNLVTRLT